MSRLPLGARGWCCSQILTRRMLEGTFCPCLCRLLPLRLEEEEVVVVEEVVVEEEMVVVEEEEISDLVRRQTC